MTKNQAGMRPLKNPCEIAVIGGGLAGLSAAHHAARLGRQVTLFEGSGLFGGLVATIDEVDGLATPGKFSGQDVAIHALEDARKLGVQIIETGIAQIELDNRITIDGSGSTDLSSRSRHRCFGRLVAQTRRSPARKNSPAAAFRVAPPATADFIAAPTSS